MRRVTIEDVAERAGVSATTVSHVLTGRRPVKAETANRVLQATAELGYVPNLGARSLRLGRSQTVGILVPDISNSYFASLARGAADASEEAGYGLSLFHTDWRADRERRYLRATQDGRVDCLVYAAGLPLSAREFKHLAVPLAVVDEEMPGVPAVTVVSDNLGGGRLAGLHLAELGHVRILHLAGPPQLRTAGLRRSGLEQAYEGVRGAHIETRPGDYTFNSGRDLLAAEINTRGIWFSAVFAGNDLMAIGAIRALNNAGLAVPDDVSVIGFDDIDLAPLVAGGLSTIHQPVYEMGYSATELLLSQLRRPTDASPAHLVLNVQLMARGTTTAFRPITTTARARSAPSERTATATADPETS